MLRNKILILFYILNVAEQGIKGYHISQLHTERGLHMFNRNIRYLDYQRFEWNCILYINFFNCPHISHILHTCILDTFVIIHALNRKTPQRLEGNMLIYISPHSSGYYHDVIYKYIFWVESPLTISNLFAGLFSSLYHIWTRLWCFHISDFTLLSILYSF